MYPPPGAPENFTQFYVHFIDSYQMDISKSNGDPLPPRREVPENLAQLYVHFLIFFIDFYHIIKPTKKSREIFPRSTGTRILDRAPFRTNVDLQS